MPPVKSFEAISKLSGIMNAEILASKDFKLAIADYFYLIDREYPEKGSLKLVGDRHRLSSELRTILYRGVCSERKAWERKQKLTNTGNPLLVIDGYNVLFTLLNYRLGRFVFISTDGICRDAGSVFGKIRREGLLKDCASLLAGNLKNSGQIQTVIYLDKPVAESIRHAELLHELALKVQIELKVVLAKSADLAILKHTKAVIATSDSTVIDSTTNQILDIPKSILSSKYGYAPFELGRLIR
jgi:hypothetical protein